MLYFDQEPRAGLPPSKSECPWPVDFVADTLQGEIIKQALSAAQNAKDAADDACKKAEAASASVEQAKTAAQSAQTVAESANTLAQSAKAAVETARDEAEAASTSAQSAKTAAETAQGKAEAASASAQSAKTAAETAQGKAEAASASVQSAKTAAETAQGKAEAASTSAQSAKTAALDSSKLSKSWAVGGTGTRTGEDTNNARYWSEQAQNAAGGGVSSFNGRSGAVAPQKGDYTAAMVGADEQGAAQTVQDNLNTHAQNTTAHISATERTAWNAKANAADLTSHVDDAVKHISATERTAWNAKANAADLTSHVDDAVKHISATERTAWNAKANAADLTSHVDDAAVHVTATEKAEWNSKVGKSTKVNLTLYASNWSTEKKYTVSNANITATSAVELLPRENNGITQAQMEALSGAMIVGGTQAAGSIQLVALGDKPTTDIPVTLIIRRDL